MKFYCQKISISDEDFGCEISFFENPDEDNEENAEKILKMSPSEVAEFMGRYISIQRSYPEDDFEKDYYYFQTSDDTGSGELKNFKIELRSTKFLMLLNNEIFDIAIKPSKKEFTNLKKVLKKIVNDRVELIIHD